MPVRANKELFIEKSIKIHGNEYDYSLVEYVNNKTKVKIICKNHGIFEQRPDNHIQNQKCPNCINNNFKSNKDEFIKKSTDKFGNLYDYSLVEYKNNKTKVKIICHRHGIFEQKPDNHLQMKTPCKKCDSENRLCNKEDLISTLNKIHNGYYDYSKLEYKGRNKKAIIICPNHGEFEQIIHSHILGSGCKKCASSNGEKLIAHILSELNIEFKTEYKFDDCKYKYKLKFDFFIPSKNICIEYNGLQHYKVVPFFGGNEYFSEIIKRDKIKEEYCLNNGITLLKIKYNTDKDKVKDIISSHLCPV